jgi:hypothetical protein
MQFSVGGTTEVMFEGAASHRLISAVIFFGKLKEWQMLLDGRNVQRARVFNGL